MDFRNADGFLPLECLQNSNGTEAHLKGQVVQRYVSSAKQVASKKVPHLKDKLLSVNKTIEAAKSELRLAKVELGLIKEQQRLRTEKKEQDEIGMKEEVMRLRAELESMRCEREQLSAEKEMITEKCNQQQWETDTAHSESEDSQTSWIASEFNLMVSELEQTNRLIKRKAVSKPKQDSNEKLKMAASRFSLRVEEGKHSSFPKSFFSPKGKDDTQIKECKTDATDLSDELYVEQMSMMSMEYGTMKAPSDSNEEVVSDTPRSESGSCDEDKESTKAVEEVVSDTASPKDAEKGDAEQGRERNELKKLVSDDSLDYPYPKQRSSSELASTSGSLDDERAKAYDGANDAGSAQDSYELKSQDDDDDLYPKERSSFKRVGKSGASGDKHAKSYEDANDAGFAHDSYELKSQDDDSYSKERSSFKKVGTSGAPGAKSYEDTNDAGFAQDGYELSSQDDDSYPKARSSFKKVGTSAKSSQESYELKPRVEENTERINRVARGITEKIGKKDRSRRKDKNLSDEYRFDETGSASASDNSSAARLSLPSTLVPSGLSGQRSNCSDSDIFAPDVVKQILHKQRHSGRKCKYTDLPTIGISSVSKPTDNSHHSYTGEELSIEEETAWLTEDKPRTRRSRKGIRGTPTRSMADDLTNIDDEEPGWNTTKSMADDLTNVDDEESNKVEDYGDLGGREWRRPKRSSQRGRHKEYEKVSSGRGVRFATEPEVIDETREGFSSDFNEFDHAVDKAMTKISKRTSQLTVESHHHSRSRRRRSRSGCRGRSHRRNSDKPHHRSQSRPKHERRNIYVTTEDKVEILIPDPPAGRSFESNRSHMSSKTLDPPYARSESFSVAGFESL